MPPRAMAMIPVIRFMVTLAPPAYAPKRVSHERKGGAVSRLPSGHDVEAALFLQADRGEEFVEYLGLIGQILGVGGGVLVEIGPAEVGDLLFPGLGLDHLGENAIPVGDLLGGKAGRGDEASPVREHE